MWTASVTTACRTTGTGLSGVGYASLVYETYQLAKRGIAAGQSHWRRFDAGAAEPMRLIQMAEQLEGPEDVLRTTYSNSTWQNKTFDAARSAARGDRGRLAEWGLSLGLFGYPDEETTNGDVIPKAALQYIENHDHERFLCNFGLVNPDEAGNPLFLEGDRSRWYMLQPYLIALLMSKGIPMLWQGQEFAENYFLPDFGAGRVSLLRPLRWDYFYDERRPLDHRAGQKAPSDPGHSQPHSARNVLLLQPLGAIPEPRTAPVCPLRGSAIHPRRSQHDGQRANSLILVSSRRRLCRRTARRRSRSQRRAGAPGVRADHTISLRSHLDQGVEPAISAMPRRAGLGQRALISHARDSPSSQNVSSERSAGSRVPLRAKIGSALRTKPLSSSVS